MESNLYGYVDSVGEPLVETNLYGYTFNDPVNFIDPDGLFPRNTREAGIQKAIARGDIAELKTLLGGGTTAEDILIKEGIKKLSTKANDFIGKFCRGSIKEEFPSQFKEKTIAEIIKAARRNVPDAKKAKKLLERKKFRK